MGNERLIGLMPQNTARGPDAYVLYQGEGTLAYALGMAEELRAAGYRILMHAGGGAFKAQMKKADASGARFALIIGDDELRAGEVSFKLLREEGEQVKLKRGQVVGTFKEKAEHAVRS